MFKTKLNCPNFKQCISLEESRTEIPVPEESTWNETVKLVYKVCPRCQVDYRVQGERAAAAIVLSLVFMFIGFSFFTDSWWPLVAVFIVLTLQKKIVQLYIRPSHA